MIGNLLKFENIITTILKIKANFCFLSGCFLKVVDVHVYEIYHIHILSIRLVKPQGNLAVVLLHTSMATYLMREANGSLLWIDNVMRCVRISLIHLKRSLTD